jgi:AcrR family transcriptional regulator
MSATTVRPRISQDFIRQHQRERLVTGLANCIEEKGYRATTVTEIVADAHVARNTFYENFGSKEECARGLLRLVVPVLDVEKVDLELGPYVLALEVAAKVRVNLPLAASALVAEAEQLLNLPLDVEPLEAEGADSPTLSKLPPGRHGLPRDFVLENQRTRLLAGTARAIYDWGYSASTIEQITAAAAVSRRTFYEHFDGKEAATDELVKLASPGEVGSLDSGLGSLWAEILAAAFCGVELLSTNRRSKAQAVLGIVGVQLRAASDDDGVDALHDAACRIPLASLPHVSRHDLEQAGGAA